MGEKDVDSTDGQQAELNPDLAGYPSTDALVAGYRASGAEAKKWRETAEASMTRLNALEQRFSGYEQTRQAVPQRSTNPYDQLSELGVPADPLRTAIQQEVQQLFRPIAEGMNARQRVVGTYPDFVKYESDVASFIESDPNLKQTYDRMFAADPVGAFEYAFLKFGDTRRRSAPATNGTGAQVQEDRAESQIPGKRSGDARRTPADTDVQEAYKRYQDTGSSVDARTYAKARLKGIITDDFLAGR